MHSMHKTHNHPASPEAVPVSHHMNDVSVEQFSQHKSIIDTPHLFEYLRQFGGHDLPQVRKLRESTLSTNHEHTAMMFESTCGRFLEWQLKVIEGLRVIEIGTYSGSTSLLMALTVQKQNNYQESKLLDKMPIETMMNAANLDSLLEQLQLSHRACPMGSILPCVLTIDPDVHTVQQLAWPHWQQANVLGHPLVYLPGDAHQVMQRLQIPELLGTFDMIFIDADKLGYQQYYEQALSLLRPGGMIIFDNTLWHGSVTQFVAAHDNNNNQQQNQMPVICDTTQHYSRDRFAQYPGALHKMNMTIQNDDRVDNILLPLGDGLHCLRKR